jgi:hypothetical protein
MTDYASQGKTRPDNVVELSHCRSHQSYYTALSRSATAAGTVIVQSFSPSPIVGGASGWLRQEFRELEILDEITKMNYESRLPPHVSGHRRNTLICNYREWRGSMHIPEHMHPAIQWSENKPYPIVHTVTDSPWQIIDKKAIATAPKETELNIQPAKGSIPVPNSKKRKFDESGDKNVDIAKKLKLSVKEIPNNLHSPIGPQWDSQNYSCAYDALFSILWYVWTTNPHKWNKIFKDLNPEIMLLANGFQKLLAGNLSIEDARDRVRTHLYQLNSEKFQWGTHGTSIADLAYEMFKKVNGVETWYQCNQCQFQTSAFDDDHMYIINSTNNMRNSSTSQILKNVMNQHQPPAFHTNCHAGYGYGFVAPKLLVFNIPNHCGILDREIPIRGINGRNTILRLKGIIYHGNFHFISRIITNDGKIWLHDGMTTGRNAMMEGNM